MIQKHCFESRWRCDSWLCHGNFDGKYGKKLVRPVSVDFFIKNWYIDTV